VISAEWQGIATAIENGMKEIEMTDVNDTLPAVTVKDSAGQ
jgi:hypothetical protein